VVGTHSLVQAVVKFAKLGLATVDEQQRMGVGQRLVLKNKGANADMLTMSATPIPRSLALVLVCVLMSDGAHTENARARIAAMCSTNDGFKLAEADLALRGPGTLFDTLQAGHGLDFRVADLVLDVEVLAAARRDAVDLVRYDPHLVAPEHRALKAALRSRWAGKLDLMAGG